MNCSKQTGVPTPSPESRECPRAWGHGRGCREGCGPGRGEDSARCLTQNGSPGLHGLQQGWGPATEEGENSPAP